MGKKVMVRVKNNAYYNGRMRSKDSVVEFDMDHCREAEKDQPRVLPRWAELVSAKEESEAEPAKTEFKETTLNNMASGHKPNVSRPNISNPSTLKKNKNAK